MFFTKKKTEPAPDRLTAFRDAIDRAIAESDLYAGIMATVLSDKADALRARIVHSAPVPSVASAGLYDAEKIQRMLSPKASQPARAGGARWG